MFPDAPALVISFSLPMTFISALHGQRNGKYGSCPFCRLILYCTAVQCCNFRTNAKPSPAPPISRLLDLSTRKNGSKDAGSVFIGNTAAGICNAQYCFAV